MVSNSLILFPYILIQQQEKDENKRKEQAEIGIKCKTTPEPKIWFSSGCFQNNFFPIWHPSDALGLGAWKFEKYNSTVLESTKFWNNSLLIYAGQLLFIQASQSLLVSSFARNCPVLQDWIVAVKIKTPSEGTHHKVIFIAKNSLLKIGLKSL